MKRNITNSYLVVSTLITFILLIKPISAFQIWTNENCTLNSLDHAIKIDVYSISYYSASPSVTTTLDLICEDIAGEVGEIILIFPDNVYLDPSLTRDTTGINERLLLESSHDQFEDLTHYYTRLKIPKTLKEIEHTFIINYQFRDLVNFDSDTGVGRFILYPLKGPHGTLKDELSSRKFKQIPVGEIKYDIFITEIYSFEFLELPSTWEKNEFEERVILKLSGPYDESSEVEFARIKLTPLISAKIRDLERSQSLINQNIFTLLNDKPKDLFLGTFLSILAIVGALGALGINVNEIINRHPRLKDTIWISIFSIVVFYIREIFFPYNIYSKIDIWLLIKDTLLPSAFFYFIIYYGLRSYRRIRETRPRTRSRRRIS